MAGRKPKPTKLKLLAGNPGGRPLPENEPQPDAAIPDPPDWMEGEALAEWRRIAPELYTLGLLSNIDRAALTQYCVAWGRWVEAERKLREHGSIILAPSGFPVQNPYLAVANKAMEVMRRLLVEFGMSPSSRAKVSATPPKGSDKEADVWAQFI